MLDSFDKSTSISLGHSPDPDDAFMFYAMAAGKIDMHGYQFEHILQDIETLNRRAQRRELHISAVSIHAYAHLTKDYALFPSGASMGDGYGPQLVTLLGDVPAGGDGALSAWLKGKKIAVPGTWTSAFLATRLFLEKEFDFIVVPFDEIFDTLREKKADVGLIIHEGQLTYAQEGFSLVRDLGEWWKELYDLPLPLGGNVVRKDVPASTRSEWAGILKNSIAWGLNEENRQEALEACMAYARGPMDAVLTNRFVGMYVNDFTLDYGEKGRKSISLFLQRGHEEGLLPKPVDVEFVSY